MKYTIEMNEMMGLIGLMMSAKHQGNIQEALSTILENTDDDAKQKHLQTLSSVLLYHVPNIKKVEDIKKIVTEYYKTDTSKAQIFNELVDQLYPDYHTQFSQQSKSLSQYISDINIFMNQEHNASEALEQFGTFCGWQIPKDHTITGYAYPSIISDGSSLTGPNGTFQVIGLTDTQYDLSNSDIRSSQISKWFHECVHGVFEESGAEKILKDYLNQPNNPLIQFMTNHPEFKRKPTESVFESARALVDESLTTAFQGLFEQQKLGRNRKTLYQNPIFDFMAHKLIDILPNMIKEGKTFDMDFIKRFEQEFLSPESQQAMKYKMEQNALDKKCKQAVTDYLTASYANNGCPLPHDFFAPKGHPAHRPEYMETAKKLLSVFTTHINSDTKIDTQFFQKLEHEHPDIKKTVTNCIASSGITGTLAVSNTQKKVSKSKHHIQSQVLSDNQQENR